MQQNRGVLVGSKAWNSRQLRLLQVVRKALLNGRAQLTRLRNSLCDVWPKLAGSLLSDTLFFFSEPFMTQQEPTHIFSMLGTLSNGESFDHRDFPRAIRCARPVQGEMYRDLYCRGGSGA